MRLLGEMNDIQFVTTSFFLKKTNCEITVKIRLHLPLTWFYCNDNDLHTLTCRGVAQSGSVSEWGSEGRRFKSSRPDHLYNKIFLIKILFFAGLFFKCLFFFSSYKCLSALSSKSCRENFKLG